MSLLNLLETIGKAKRGTRVVVTKQFDAADSMGGVTVTLPVGTVMQITMANGESLEAVAEVRDSLHSVILFARHYTMIELQASEPTGDT